MYFSIASGCCLIEELISDSKPFWSEDTYSYKEERFNEA